MEEIFFDERDSSRFQQHSIPDYMRRDGTRVVSFPLSVPHANLIADLEYYGIDYVDLQRITLSISDPKDMFHHLVSYRDFFLNEQQEVDTHIIVM